MEIITCTINHAEYLYHTYEAFKNHVTDLDLSKCTLYLNIDPFPNNNNFEQVITMAKKYFPNIKYRIGNTYSASAGLIWAIPQIKNDYFFILGGGKTLCGDVSIEYMKDKLFNDEKAVQIFCLNGNKKYADYLGVIPTLAKTDFFKQVYLKYAVPHVEVEYQLRELSILTNNNYCLNYKIDRNIHEYYPRDIKSYEFKDKWNVIYANMNTDIEIKDLIQNNGEWHYNIIKQMDLKLNSQVNINFILKSFDKKWIYRWTGYFGFVPKKHSNLFRRHWLPSKTFFCNIEANKNIDEIKLNINKYNNIIKNPIYTLL